MIIFEILSYIFTLVGILLLALYSMVALVAVGCSNAPSESTRPMIFLLLFVSLFGLSVVSFLGGFWGIDFLGVNIIYFGALLSVIPLGILFWLRQLSIPSVSTP
jgi:hypothetical protein